MAQRGLSLLELTVVAAIIAILAALTAVSVTGSTTTSRSVTRASEITELQKAVERFAGVTADYPTLSRAVADSERTEGVDFFRVTEGPEGVNRDVNGDGDAADGGVARIQGPTRQSSPANSMRNRLPVPPGRAATC